MSETDRAFPDFHDTEAAIREACASVKAAADQITAAVAEWRAAAQRIEALIESIVPAPQPGLRDRTSPGVAFP